MAAATWKAHGPSAGGPLPSSRPRDFARGRLHPEWRDLLSTLIVARRSLRSAWSLPRAKSRGAPVETTIVPRAKFLQGVSDLSALSAPRLISLKGCAPAQSPTRRILSPADVGDGSAAAHRFGEVGVGGDPVLNGAAGDAKEIAQHLVGGADPLRVSVDRHTPQHCSVLSTTISARCVHDSVRKIILAYRHRARGSARSGGRTP
jgi:hypothetical protein